MASAGSVGSTGSTGSTGGGGGGGAAGAAGLFPSLQCGPATRRGRRLVRPKIVQVPTGCRKSDTGRGAALCDEPGDDYPWDAIDKYLRHSSDFVKKRVENTLKASRISAPNSLRSRRSRSADDISRDDVVNSDVTGEKIRAKKHVDPPSGNWEGSGAGAEDEATSPTSIGDNVDLTFADDSTEGSGSETTTPTTDAANVTDEDNIDALVSFFLKNEPADDVTKDALKDMLKFRRTFVTPSSRDDVLVPPTTTDVPTAPPTSDQTPPTSDPTAPTDDPTPPTDDPTRLWSPAEPTAATVNHSAHRHTSDDAPFNDVTGSLRPAKRSEAERTTTALTWDSPTDPTDERDDELGTAASERHEVLAMPEALPLIARPPKIVHFNPPAFSVRQRVTVAKTTRLSAPPTYEPELDDFTELVYASAAQRPVAEAEVAPPPTRTTPMPTTTLPPPTPDPYTESACSFWEEVRSPFYAMNTHNEWKTLINMPNYETYIHMEHCMAEKSQGRCAEGCRCTQKYTIRNMPVYDTDANGCDIIYMDKFLFPSHCDCTCLPPGYTLFRKPPLPTTPLPEEVDFVGPLAEGWLPERPNEARQGQVTEEVTELEEVEEVEERRKGETDVDVEVVEVVEDVQEEEKAEDATLPSSGRPEQLKSASRPAVAGVRQTVAPQRREATQRVTPARAPPPAAIRRHVTVQPRPRRPTAGPPRDPAGPQRDPVRPTALRWEGLARRQPAEQPSQRNHLRGPPAALRRR